MKKLRTMLLLAMFAVTMLAIPKRVYATESESLTGNLSINYSASTGKLSALYDGNLTLSGSETYTWYCDGNAVSTNKSYSPTKDGGYYCTLKDTSLYTGQITSKTIILYKASGQNLTFDNSYGLYESGDYVSVSIAQTDNQVVSNWKVSAAGVAIPETGNTVSFRMPAQNVTVTTTLKTKVQITVNGGTADKYEAFQGDSVTIVASEVSGKQFVSWSSSGGRLADANSKTTTLTVANSNVTVTANFNGTTTSTTNNNNNNNNDSYNNNYNNYNNGKANAINTVYSVLDNQGYNIQFYHHTQGPLCDAAFKYAQGYDWLVTDYFNLTVNNSFTTYEINNPLKIQLTIPDDLIKAGRNWRMVCVSRGGQVYTFPDEDSNDSTITFSPNRFYAYAMCYNDIQPTVEEPFPVETTVAETTPTEAAPSEVTVQQPVVTSEFHSAQESKTATSAVHSADASITYNVEGVATTPTGKTAHLKSDQKPAVEQADGAQIPLISM